MTARPILLTGPYLAMWLWLIVPLALLALAPFGGVSDRLSNGQIHVHIGGTAEEIDQADSLGDALRIMNRDRTYDVCRYIRVNQETTSLVLLPPDQKHCSLFRIIHPNQGRVVRSISTAFLVDDLIKSLKRSF